MIITEQKKPEEILKSLEKSQKIFLIGCGECSTTCKTGGEAEVLKMKEELIKAGKEVLGTCIPSAPCLASKVKTEIAKHMSEFRQSEAVLVLACGLGVQSVKENDRFGLNIIPACNTLCGALMDSQGNFQEKCSMCAECILDKTAGICPVTLCPKGILNGPCGGMDKGKCEVDKDRDCAWVLIYREMEKKNSLGGFKEILPAKDFKKMVKPRKLIMTK